MFLRNNAMHTVRVRVIDAFYAMLKRRAGETATPSPTAGDGVVVGVQPPLCIPFFELAGRHAACPVLQLLDVRLARQRHRHVRPIAS